MLKRLMTLLCVLTSITTLLLTFVRLANATGTTACTVGTTHATIQAAVDDLTCNPIMLPADSFVENVVLRSREIVIDGAGAGQTVIDGGGVDTAFTIDFGSDVTLRNMTIRNGFAATGSRGGGGIFVDSSRVTIEMSELVDNHAPTVPGGGLYALNSSVTLHGSQVYGNSSGSFGGGIYNQSGMMTVTASSIYTNHVSGGSGLAGGVGTGFGTLIISDSTIINNSAVNFDGAYGLGGGVYCGQSTCSFSRLLAQGNRTARYGGGFALVDSRFTVEETMVLSNSAHIGGGFHVAIFESGVGTITQSTVDHNVAAFGGGMSVVRQLEAVDSVYVSDTRLRFNGLTSRSEQSIGSAILVDVDADYADSMRFNNNCIENNAGIAISAGSDDDEGIVDFQMNWWGSGDGPSGSGSGSGDAIEGNVDFSNFSAEAIAGCEGDMTAVRMMNVSAETPPQSTARILILLLAVTFVSGCQRRSGKRAHTLSKGAV